MAFRIAQIGTFDCENFGDLLFPEVLAYNLNKRINIEEIVLFSPIGGTMPFYPDIQVFPISKLEQMHNENPFDAVIIGGGDILRLDYNVASFKGYNAQNSSVYLWIYPTLFANKYSIPIFWNNIGVPFPLNSAGKKLAYALMSQTDYLSVRDKKSKDLLSFFDKKPCHVFPDTILSISRQLNPDDLNKALRDVEKENQIDLNERYLIFQANCFENDSKKIAVEIKKIAKNQNLKIVLMPIGYVHSDLLFLEKYKELDPQSFFILNNKLSPIQMIAVISHSSYFIGTSLHGNVIAYEFGVPFLAYLPKPLNKLNGFLEMVHCENRKFTCSDELLSAYKNTKNAILSDKDELIRQIDCHFDNIAKIIKSGLKKVPVECNELTDTIASLGLFMSLSTQFFTIYYDTGTGYSEDNKSRYYFENNTFDFSFDIPENTINIRIDPTESPCLLTDLEISSQSIKKNVFCSNAFIATDCVFLFDKADPNLEISITESDKKLFVRGNCSVLSSNELEAFSDSLCDIKEAVLNYKDSEFLLKNRIEHLENTIIKDLKNKNTFIEQSFFQALNELNGIYNSRSWRLMVKMNRITGKIRRFINKHKFLLKIAHGIKYILKGDISGLVARIKNRTSNEQGIDYKKLAFSKKELERQRNYNFKKNVKFSILIPLYNTPSDLLKETIESVISQTYGNWELCLADGSDSQHNYVENICNEYANIDSRIKYKKLDNNLGISDNTNACAELASGDYIALFDHDDLLYPNALFENAIAIELHQPDVLYSDEDKVDINGVAQLPFYKPDWSRDLLYSQMYICHFLVFKKSLFEKIGGYNKKFDGAQDYDLMLRFSEQTDNIYHIPKILYSWRMTENSTSANSDSKPYAQSAGLNALNAHLKRYVKEDAFAEETNSLFVFSSRFPLKYPKPKVSVIMPMKDNCKLSDTCVKSILAKTNYSNYDIIILDNNSEKQKTFDWFEKIKKRSDKIRIIPAKFPFNWSKLNNFGMQYSDADVFIFLNNDMEVISPDWMELLCENAMRKDIGVVGPLLLYADNTIQHAGVVLGMGGWADHVFKGMDPVNYSSPFVSPIVNRNVLSVTGACMAVSRKTIEKIGKFDENFIICGSDVELCLRAYENGFRNLYLSNVKLYHYESQSRDSYIPESDFENSKRAYSPYIGENTDPFFNINLDINSCQPKLKEQ